MQLTNAVHLWKSTTTPSTPGMIITQLPKVSNYGIQVGTNNENVKLFLSKVVFDSLLIDLTKLYDYFSKYHQFVLTVIKSEE